MRRLSSFNTLLLLPVFALALSASAPMLATPAGAMPLLENQNACGEPLYVADQIIIDFAWAVGDGELDLAKVNARVQEIFAQIPREEDEEDEEAEVLRFKQLPPRPGASPSISVLAALAGSLGPLELSARLRQLPAVKHARPNFLYSLGDSCEDATAVEGFDTKGSLVAAHVLATTDRLLLRLSRDEDHDWMTGKELKKAVRLSFREIGLAGTLSIQILPGIGFRVQSSEIPDARAVAFLLTALEEIEWAQPDPASSCSIGEAGEGAASNPCGLIRDQDGRRNLVLLSSNFGGGDPPLHSSGGALGLGWAWGILVLRGLRPRRKIRGSTRA